jgi:hypothetical protein
MDFECGCARYLRHVRMSGAGIEEWGQGGVLLPPGYALPRSLHAAADLGDGLRVEIDVEVTDVDRAIARRVTVEADRGVTAAALRRVPIRDVLAAACLDVLQRFERRPDGSFVGVRPGPENADEARRIIQRLVGYDPDAHRFQGKVEVRP